MDSTEDTYNKEDYKQQQQQQYALPQHPLAQLYSLVKKSVAIVSYPFSHLLPQPEQPHPLAPITFSNPIILTRILHILGPREARRLARTSQQFLSASRTCIPRIHLSLLNYRGDPCERILMGCIDASTDSDGRTVWYFEIEGGGVGPEIMGWRWTDKDGVRVQVRKVIGTTGIDTQIQSHDYQEYVIDTRDTYSRFLIPAQTWIPQPSHQQNHPQQNLVSSALIHFRPTFHTSLQPLNSDAQTPNPPSSFRIQSILCTNSFLNVHDTKSQIPLLPPSLPPFLTKVQNTLSLQSQPLIPSDPLQIILTQPQKYPRHIFTYLSTSQTFTPYLSRLSTFFENFTAALTSESHWSLLDSAGSDLWASDVADDGKAMVRKRIVEEWRNVDPYGLFVNGDGDVDVDMVWYILLQLRDSWVHAPWITSVYGSRQLLPKHGCSVQCRYCRWEDALFRPRLEIVEPYCGIEECGMCRIGKGDRCSVLWREWGV